MNAYAEWKPVQQGLGLTADGYAGPKTLAAVAEWLGVKEDWRAVQYKVDVKADGVAGASTAIAVANRLGIDIPVTWPTKDNIRSGNSIFGYAGDESNLVVVSTPYPLYFDGQKVSGVRCHRMVAGAVKDALRKVLEHYGPDEVRRLKLDVFDGCYNNRSVRGGTSTSMHAWGIALDFYASANGMNDKTGKAPLSRPEYKAWFDIWESVGARSFGRRNGYDWMHVEFVSPIVGGS